MKNRGKFIVFEGIDGSGKSTQIKMLYKSLKERGIPCLMTGEPTQSPFGSMLRCCLGGRIETDEYTIAALFAADRLDHIFHKTTGILNKLEEGTNVLCDRYYLSSFAYNGGMADDEWVIGLNKVARETLKPDLTIFLDLSPEESMRRVLRRGETDRYETAERQINIRNRYFELFKRFPDERVEIVKSEADKDATQEKIRALVEREFKK